VSIPAVTLNLRSAPPEEEIRALPDHDFLRRWPEINVTHGSSYPEAVRVEFVERYKSIRRKTTPYSDELLGDVHAFLGRFVVYPSPEAQTAHTLWIAHTHLMDVWESTPRIAFLSPEPASGKTRALEITETLVPRPVEAINATPAYIFRKVSDEEGRPTILYDEIDTLFGPKAKDNEEIRGVLNAGHRKGAIAGRCVTKGKTIETEELPAYCAVAIAGLGNLPDTILTRSVIIRMRRRAPGENIEAYRRRFHAPEGNALRDQLSAWASQISIEEWPEMPDGVSDRDADVWEALIAVADAAGGTWPKLARDAAVMLVTSSKADSGSLGLRLLADLKEWIFKTSDVVATKDILRTLHEIEEAPWGDLRGKPLDARYLANLLKPYGINSRVLTGGEHRGYRKQDFHDAWTRYTLPPATSVTSVTDVTPEASAQDEVVTGVTLVTHSGGDTVAAGANGEGV
jgi:hypothetical protein